MSVVKNPSPQLRTFETLPPDTSAEHFRQRRQTRPKTLPPNTSAEQAFQMSHAVERVFDTTHPKVLNPKSYTLRSKR